MFFLQGKRIKTALKVSQKILDKCIYLVHTYMYNIAYKKRI